jgi:hypothetical protein
MSSEKRDDVRLEAASLDSPTSPTKRVLSSLGSEDGLTGSHPMPISFGDAAQIILGEKSRKPSTVAAEENSRILRKVSAFRVEYLAVAVCLSLL